jgi:hypothetical protein
VAKNPDGSILGKCKKMTKIRTTKESLAIGLSCKCKCKELHVQGRGPHLAALANYPKLMCKELAFHMAMEATAEDADFASTTDLHEVECLCSECTSLNGGRHHYPHELQRNLAKHIVQDDGLQMEEDAGDEFDKVEHGELLKELRKRFDLETLRAVIKLHNMFGHPSAAALGNSLKGMEAPWSGCAAPRFTSAKTA